MSKLQRATNIATGILMIICAVLMALHPKAGYVIVILFMCITLTLAGIRMIIYYFTMARHMVGGMSILYRGIILYDFGLLSGTLIGASQVYILLYLVGVHLFSGAVDIMRTLEARHYEGASWRLRLSHGIMNILIAVACLVFIRSTDVAVYIYCFGLIYSAIMRIVTAFRRTAIVYIQ